MNDIEIRIEAKKIEAIVSRNFKGRLYLGTDEMQELRHYISRAFNTVIVSEIHDLKFSGLTIYLVNERNHLEVY